MLPLVPETQPYYLDIKHPSERLWNSQKKPCPATMSTKLSYHSFVRPGPFFLPKSCHVAVPASLYQLRSDPSNPSPSRAIVRQPKLTSTASSALYFVILELLEPSTT